MSVEVKLSLPLESCPVCSIPLDFLRVFKLARDLQMRAFTARVTGERCENIKVEDGVICFVCLSQVHLRQQLRGQIKKQDERC